MSQLNVVLYTDGGAVTPQPKKDGTTVRGPGGSGIFGYTYRDTAEPPVDGEQHPTTHGYYSLASKPEEAEWVTPVEYIEVCVAYPMSLTNNAAELSAAQFALDIIMDKQYRHALICPDSMYVLDGYTKYLEKWQSRGWVTSNNDPIENLVIWEKLLKYKLELAKRGYTVDWKWVKGHSNEYGNVRADALASKGLSEARRSQAFKRVDITPAIPLPRVTDKEIPDRNDLLSFPRWYFVNDGPATKPDEDGKFVYYGGFHGKPTGKTDTSNGKKDKSDDNLAKPMSDSCYCVSIVNEADPTMELLREHQFRITKSPIPLIVIAKLDFIMLKPNYMKLYRQHNGWLEPHPGTEDLYFEYGMRITHSLNHPRLAYDAISRLGEAEELLRQCLTDTLPSHYLMTDITDTIYDEQPPKKKQRLILKPEITVSTKILAVDISYIRQTGEKGTFNTRLLLGQDSPARNVLGRLAAFEPEVYLLSWMRDPATLCFATVVKCTKGASIWIGHPANYRLIPLKRVPS